MIFQLQFPKFNRSIVQFFKIRMMLYFKKISVQIFLVVFEAINSTAKIN